MLDFITNDGIKVKIRPAKLEDAPSLQRNCLPENTLDEVSNFLKRDVEETKRGNKLRLVAEVEGKVVGNLEIFFMSHPLSPHIAGIATVVVNPRFRRRYIALNLIEWSLKTAKGRKREIVRIDVEAKNIPAVKLYNKAGFKEYGRLERGLIRNGDYDDLILMKKDL